MIHCLRRRFVAAHPVSRSTATCLAFVVLFSGGIPVLGQERLWHVDDAGRFRVKPWPIPAELRNQSWTDKHEEDFQTRVDWVIRNTAKNGKYGGTYFENEKRAYGWAMLSILGGFEEQGLAFLQGEDADAKRWHAGTEGIDFYPSFTLKHQVRKCFYFGPYLEPSYRERMRRGAQRFTEVDPLRRPHPAFSRASGWGPDAKNSWVDVRDTDNLKLMRETSVYLFAEETGNDAVRDLYRRRITENVVAMYWMGMGEWDSENYLGHTISPLVNLYDFAKDPNLKLLAKAALDRCALNLATKYWRGNYNGPSRRDYGHPYPFGGSAAMAGWLWYGDAPTQPIAFESDEAELVTSGYRPPVAMVEFARRNFPKPLAILSGKPDGSPWNHLDAPEPRFYETQYFGKAFQFGTLLRGTEAPDVNGFKILVSHPKRGADTIMAAPVRDATLIASPRYTDHVLAPNSAVGQHGPLAIYLTQESEHPYRLLIPADAKTEQHGNATFVLCDQVTVALWPINCERFAEDREATEAIQWSKSSSGDRIELWPHSRILTASRKGPGVYGFAIEVDDSNRKRFIHAASQLSPETDELAIRGAVAFSGTTGKRVRLQWGDSHQAIHVWLDGRKREMNSPENRAAYHTLRDSQSESSTLVEQGWQTDGTLRVAAGGHRFECTVERDGRVRFSEQ
jgi:hypothetical protein